MTRLFSSLLLIMVSVLLYTGCVKKTPPPPDQITEPEELYQAMMARLEPVNSARIVASLEYFGDNGRVKLTQAVLVERPSNLRVETLSPFNTTMSVLTSDGSRLKFLDLQANEYFEGQATASNLARLIPIYISPDDLVNVLLGGPPTEHLKGTPESWELHWDKRKAAYSLTVPRIGGGEFEIFVKHRAWTVSGAIARDVEGETIYEVRTGNYKTIRKGEASVLAPRRIQFLMQSQGIDASLDVDRYELNPELPAELFELSAPQGIEKQEL